MSKSADKQDKKTLSQFASTKEIRDAMRDLYHRLQDVEDFRRSASVKYSLSLAFMLLIIGLMIGKNDPTNIALFLNTPGIKIQIAKLLGYSGAIPSKQVFLRLLAQTPPSSFMTVIDEWMREYFPPGNAHIALDGKAVRAALEKIMDQHHPPYNLGAVCVGTGMFIMQERVGKKTNETASLRGFAAKLELNNSYATIDAAGTHSDIASIIISSNGHFALPTKDNQKHLRLAIEAAFMQPDEVTCSKIDIFDDDRSDVKAHGRYERRIARVLPVLPGTKLYRFIQASSFRDMVGAVGMIERYREVEKRNELGERISEPTKQVVYYIMDEADMTAKKLNELVRAHWSIESCHYVMDMVFQEDASTIRTGYAMENMSLIRKIAHNLLRLFRKVFSKGTRCVSFQHTRDRVLTDLGCLSGIFKPYSQRELRALKLKC